MYLCVLIYVTSLAISFIKKVAYVIVIWLTDA
jgi:hypothetical protein